MSHSLRGCFFFYNGNTRLDDLFVSPQLSTKQRIYDLNIDSSINFIVNVVSPRKAASIYVPVCVGFQVKIHIDIRLSECCQKKKKTYDGYSCAGRESCVTSSYRLGRYWQVRFLKCGTN